MVTVKVFSSKRIYNSHVELCWIRQWNFLWKPLSQWRNISYVHLFRGTDRQSNFIRSTKGLRKGPKQRQDKSVTRQCSNKCLRQTRSNVAVTSLQGYIPNSRFLPPEHFNVGYSCYHPKNMNTTKPTYTTREETKW